MMKRIRSLLGYLLYRLFSFLPIDKDLIVYESQNDYSDNSWALYQYVKHNRSRYKHVWLFHKKESLLKYGKGKDLCCILFPPYFTVSSAWYLARAKYVFFTHGLINRVKCRKGQILFNLWHGIALKASKSGNKPYYTYTLALGEKNQLTQAKFLGCDPNIVLPLGYPRNDILINNITEGRYNPFIDGKKGKVIIWMPTFRASTDKSISELLCDNSTGLPMLENPEDVESFNSFLLGLNVMVIVKIHHLQASKAIFNKQFSNIQFLSDKDLERKNLQLYEVIGKSDALLTDYSSVMMDYLLVNKPMGFIINDIDKYSKSRGGFVFDNIKEVLAGYHIYSLSDLHDFIIEINNNIDSTKEKRASIVNEMIVYNDGNSSQRILDYLGM